MEYDLPEAAQLALEQMNGVLLGGRNIKVSIYTLCPFADSDFPYYSTNRRLVSSVGRAPVCCAGG